MDIIYLILTNLRRLLRKKKIITLIILLFLILNLLNLIFECSVKASSDNIDNIRHLIVNAFSGKIGSYEYGTIDENAFNQDLGADKTLVLYFIYNNPTNKYFDIIVLMTGNTAIKTGTNGFIKDNNANLEHIVYQNWRTADWRSTVEFKHIIVDYNYNFINYENSRIERTPIGSYNINTLFNINNITYDNLLMVSPNYKGTFLKIFPNFQERKIAYFKEPSIDTAVSSFKYWNFNSVEINGGSFDLNKGDMDFIISYYNQIGSSDESPFQKYETSTKIKLDKSSPYVNINEENGECFFTASIPRNELLKSVNLRNGAYIDIGLHGSYYASNLPNGEITFYSGETGISLVLDSNYEEDLQKEKESQERQELINNQKETNEKLDENNKKLEETNNNIKDTNDFLKNDNVPDDNEFNLPSVDIDDPTANFFDTMFICLYNAVNVEGNQQISFKIFSKDIVINSDDFNFLVGNEWGILRIILTSSWVFGIGIFILKDIRKMIDKIKSGNIDSVATDDIKADMV